MSEKRGRDAGGRAVRERAGQRRMRRTYHVTACASSRASEMTARAAYAHHDAALAAALEGGAAGRPQRRKRWRRSMRAMASTSSSSQPSCGDWRAGGQGALGGSRQSRAAGRAVCGTSAPHKAMGRRAAETQRGSHQANAHAIGGRSPAAVANWRSNQKARTCFWRMRSASSVETSATRHSRGHGRFEGSRSAAGSNSTCGDTRYDCAFSRVLGRASERTVSTLRRRLDFGVTG